MRSLLERDFAATEICHFFNHDQTEFSCKFINVNLTEEEEFEVEVDYDDKVKLKAKNSGIPFLKQQCNRPENHEDALINDFLSKF